MSAPHNLHHAVKAASEFTTLTRQISEQRDHVKKLRDEAKQREEEVDNLSKSKQAKAREQARRAQITGEVVLAVANNDPDFWDQLMPHLITRLMDATDNDRTLFGLPALSKRDDEKVSAAANFASDPKRQDEKQPKGQSEDEEKQPSPAPIAPHHEKPSPVS